MAESMCSWTIPRPCGTAMQEGCALSVKDDRCFLVVPGEVLTFFSQDKWDSRMPSLVF